MKISFLSRWFNRHLDKQPPYIKKLLTQSSVLRTDKEVIARSVAIGLFLSCMPLPFHSLLAIVIAISFTANPLIAYAIVWIVNNPITMVPVYYFCYRVGLLILHLPPQPFAFEQSWSWVAHELELIWQPFLLGCLATGAILALAGYIFIRLTYRIKK